MSERFGFDSVKENCADVGREFAHSAIANPWNGFVQLADTIPGVKLTEMHSQGAHNKDSLAVKTATLAGIVVDFGALSLVTRKVNAPLLKALGVSEKSALASAWAMGATGGIYGGVFTKSESGDHLFASRLKQATVQAGTFASMSLATHGFGGGVEGGLLRRMTVNAAGGAVGGVSNSLLQEGLINHRLASGSEIAKQAGTFALFGAAVAGLGFKVGEAVSSRNLARGGEVYPPEMTETLTPFKRLSAEPILGPREGKFDSAGAFNPTATRLPDGDVAILYRAQDAKGVSTVGYARTGPDGVKILERSEEPVLAPKVENEKLGIEDPRVTADPVNSSQWDLTATKWDGKNAQLADWTSADLKTWKERGIMMPANEGTWNKQWTKSGSMVSREIDGKFVPEKINGKFWMFYMGSRGGIDEMGLASSFDGKKWIDATKEPILPGRPGHFDSHVVEPGPAAIVTKDGISLIYSGGSHYEGGNGMSKYQSGLAVFSKEDPTKLLFRSNKPVFSPETSWEIENSSSTVHQVPNVVFPQGIVPDGQGGYLLYYGAADSYVGVAGTTFKPVNQFRVAHENLNRSLMRAPVVFVDQNDKDKPLKRSLP